MSMIKPVEGDSVKLTLEGVVDYVDSNGFRFREGKTYHVFNDPVAVNMVVTPKPRVVGEKISRADLEAAGFAPGTVISRRIDAGSTVCYMKSTRTHFWINIHGIEMLPLEMQVGQYTIEVLP